MIIEKDFGDTLSQSVEERHSFKAQGTRRKSIGRARNYLLDVDVVGNPETVIEDLMKHDKDVIVPNIWFHRTGKDGKEIEGRCEKTRTFVAVLILTILQDDYNSWQESWRGRRMRSRLNKDTILAEGYAEYRTHRSYLNWMAYDNRKKRLKYLHKEVPLDGIGGVNILVKAEVHRSGINFPCYAFENQADTEGFAAMAKRAKYGVWGLPNYVVWHIDTEEKEGNMAKAKDREKMKKKQSKEKDV
ncbi:MAG: hypothetical protein Q9222_002815 [Ikaeria aurantiellina]